MVLQGTEHAPPCVQSSVQMLITLPHDDLWQADTRSIRLHAVHMHACMYMWVHLHTPPHSQACDCSPTHTCAGA